MKPRTIAALFVMTLAVGVAGISGGRPHVEAQTSGKVKLRAQVIQLRTEIDVLELDHDALKDSILTQIKTTEATESLGGQLGAMALEMQLMMGKQPSKELQAAMEAKDEKDQERLMNEAIKKQADEVQATIARKKKSYADQAAKLAEKRLDLEDLEIQYRAAR